MVFDSPALKSAPRLLLAQHAENSRSDWGHRRQNVKLATRRNRLSCAWYGSSSGSTCFTPASIWLSWLDQRLTAWITRRSQTTWNSSGQATKGFRVTNGAADMDRYPCRRTHSADQGYQLVLSPGSAEVADLQTCSQYGIDALEGTKCASGPMAHDSPIAALPPLVRGGYDPVPTDNAPPRSH